MKVAELRTSLSRQDPDVEAKIVGLAKETLTDGEETFLKVEALSKRMVLLKLGYEHSAYQCYMATCMLSADNHPWRVMVAEPGSGKSFAIALLANALGE